MRVRLSSGWITECEQIRLLYDSTKRVLKISVDFFECEFESKYEILMSEKDTDVNFIIKMNKLLEKIERELLKKGYFDFKSDNIHNEYNKIKNEGDK